MIRKSITSFSEILAHFFTRTPNLWPKGEWSRYSFIRTLIDLARYLEDNFFLSFFIILFHSRDNARFKPNSRFLRKSTFQLFYISVVKFFPSLGHRHHDRWVAQKKKEKNNRAIFRHDLFVPTNSFFSLDWPIREPIKIPSSRRGKVTRRRNGRKRREEERKKGEEEQLRCKK